MYLLCMHAFMHICMYVPSEYHIWMCADTSYAPPDLCMYVCILCVCMYTSSECLILMCADTANAAPDAAIASKTVCVCVYVCM